MRRAPGSPNPPGIPARIARGRPGGEDADQDGPYSRRDFPTASGRVLAEDPADPAAETPVVGPIGRGGMGRFDTAVFMNLGVPEAVVCDVDGRHAGPAADTVEEARGRRPAIVRDFRTPPDRGDIDAVSVL